jgi:cell wall-associated NlpC family hydrolase
MITAAPDVKSAPLASLSMGAFVWTGTTVGSFTEIKLYGRAGKMQTGYLPCDALVPLTDRQKDWPAFAERFLGAPYKWGGRSAAGLDCSALIQLALAAIGYKVPRDSGPQQAFMAPAAKTPSQAFRSFQRGDIIFWDGHVGVCLNETDILHANAHHSRVAIEPIDDAIERIAQTEGQPTRHIGAEQLLDLLDNVAGT